MRLIISDVCRGLTEAAGEVFPNADWQRRVVHFYRNVFSHVPNTKIREVARMLRRFTLRKIAKPRMRRAKRS
jgi:transposase-like protein